MRSENALVPPPSELQEGRVISGAASKAVALPEAGLHGNTLSIEGEILTWRARCTFRLFWLIWSAPFASEWGAPQRLRVPTNLGFKSARNIQSAEVNNRCSGGFVQNQGYNWFSGSQSGQLQALAPVPC
jgi:hypothetical protein